MAAADQFAITVHGRGGHAAYPQACIDPVAAAVQIAQGLLAIPARRVDPLAQAVVSLTVLRAGEATNVIPETAVLARHGAHASTRRCARRSPPTSRRLAEATAAAHGARAEVDYEFGYPVTVNDPAEARLRRGRGGGGGRGGPGRGGPLAGDGGGGFRLHAAGAARRLCLPRHRPGAGLHNPRFDYNDEASPIGASYFVRLVETALPLAR